MIGFFCRAGEAAPSGPCDPGFYCSGGAKLSHPNDGEIDPTSGKEDEKKCFLYCIKVTEWIAFTKCSRFNTSKVKSYA